MAPRRATLFTNKPLYWYEDHPCSCGFKRLALVSDDQKSAILVCPACDDIPPRPNRV